MSSFREGELAGGYRVPSSPRSGGSLVGPYATIVLPDPAHGPYGRIHGVALKEAPSRAAGVEGD